MHKLIVALSVALLVASLALFADDTNTDRWQTRSGYYWISYSSDISPVEINRIHRWVFHVEDESGKPVKGAEITLIGGMPEHNHGLPTSPRMTEVEGPGDYAVEGMRFHMAGYWELTVTIDVADRRDTVIIPLTIS